MNEIKFPNNFFKGNRAKLRGLFSGSAPIVLTAHGLLQSNSDSNFKFTQDSSFWYLTGISIPDIILVIDRSKEYLIVPKQEVWQKSSEGEINYSHLSKISGIETVLTEDEGWKTLKSKLKKVKHVATLAAAPAYIEHYGLYANPARARLIKRLKAINPGIELLDLRQHLMRQRVIKQSIEIEAIQSAVDITNATLKKVGKKINQQKYSSENEIEADITHGFRSMGADGHGFDPIVASGSNATIIHYLANNQRLKKNDLVLIDIGAEVSHYTADIARTYIYGKPTLRYKQVYSAANDIERYILSQLMPGVVPNEFEKLIENFVGEKLRELGLIKTISRETVRKYFPHRASHFFGLDAHDAGDYTKPLEPGMAFTAEPGLYIPKEGIGVRIEDDLIITKEGNRLLSGSLSHELD